MPRFGLMVWIFSTISSACPLQGVLANSLHGPAFSDPSKQLVMPKSWSQKPITRANAPADTDLSITIDQYLYPALVPLINQYAAEHKLKIDVQKGTCGSSTRGLIEKRIDIAGYCCPASQTDRLPNIQFHTIGISAIAILVHAKNPIANIGKTEIQDIFRGNSGYWYEVDKQLPDHIKRELIQPVARLHCKSRPGHWRLILDHEDLFSPRLFEVDSASDVIRRVSNSVGAIGFEGVQIQHANEVHTVNIDGYSPTDPQALLNGGYPFYHTHNLTTWVNSNNPDDKAVALVTYLQNNLESIARQYSLVPSNQLRRAGWRFTGAELTGEPH